MTTLRIEWEHDPEDDVTRSAEADRFFAAWVNQFGVIEWTCTDEDEFGYLTQQMPDDEV